MLSQHQAVLSYQDTRLDSISDSVARAKNTSLAISDELTQQDQVMADAGRDFERGTTRVQRETERVEDVRKYTKSDKLVKFLLFLFLVFFMFLLLTDGGCKVVPTGRNC
eukprot:gnl/Ergobibamus_cyprinoides/1058.p3 GENE.gnl/Ergobibamus_cyprinoides/1058~~gnl/Ergobibamus_cyprinoides/1058.p3  ORF type:complete len:109 (-),score=26.00 gnl/Ergobibamus_cyprinoides/1058:16-342(-)